VELILINNKKLKVMLTPDDMARYELTCENIDCEDAPTRRALRAVLDDASASCGFDSHERVFIQVYPSRGGGCEIFVTRLTGEDIAASDAEPADGTVRSDAQQYGVKRITSAPAAVSDVPDREYGSPPRHTLWRTESMSALISMCAALWRLGGCTADAFYSDERSCVLLLYGGCGSEALASEFSVRVGASLGAEELYSYINERCTLICREALGRLSSLA